MSHNAMDPSELKKPLIPKPLKPHPKYSQGHKKYALLLTFGQKIPLSV